MKQEKVIPQVTSQNAIKKSQLKANLNQSQQKQSQKCISLSLNQQMLLTGVILRKNVSQNIFNNSDQHIQKQNQIPILQFSKDQSTIFSHLNNNNNNILDQIISMKDTSPIIKKHKQSFGGKSLLLSKQQQQNTIKDHSINISHQQKTQNINQETNTTQITLNSQINNDDLDKKQEVLKNFKLIFHEVQKEIIRQFSTRLDEETVMRDGKKIPILIRMKNYGSSKENTLFHLNKYLEFCVYNNRVMHTPDDIKHQSIQSEQMNYQRSQQINDSDEQNGILYQIPREVSVLFMECIEHYIQNNDIILDKEYITSLFKDKIQLLQPKTHLLEICSTERLQNIIEIIYNALEDEPYITYLVPKKTPETLSLVNQLANNLLIKNFSAIPRIIALIKKASIFRDPQQSILKKLLIFEQIELEIQKKNSPNSPINIPYTQIILKEQLSKDHYFEKATHVDFYIMKCAIRKALEKRGNLSYDEINLFLETIEETRYIVMPHLYKWTRDEENIKQLIKFMSSKIFALGSDFLNQYFPLLNTCTFIQQFCQQITQNIIIQPNFEELKRVLTLNDKGKLQFKDISNKPTASNKKVSSKASKLPLNSQNVSQMMEQDNQYKLKLQLKLIKEISDIMIQSQKQLNYTILTQRDISVRFLKIARQFIPQDTSHTDLADIDSELTQININFTNIESIIDSLKNYISKKYHKKNVHIYSQSLCNLVRDFLLSFYSLKIVYSIDDLISALKYYEIPEEELELIIEGIEYSLNLESLWNDKTKKDILKEFDLI